VAADGGSSLRAVFSCRGFVREICGVPVEQGRLNAELDRASVVWIAGRWIFASVGFLQIVPA
jgi:hypothetical protein